jgi:hypothetical protein
MPAVELELQNETERDRVVRWRADELERAGYGTEAAREIAERLDIDLHRATDLLRDGCPADTAVRILL